VREWRWPRAGKIKFSHLQFETTVYDWQGAQIALICFDELTHFTAHQFFYIVSRNRSTCGVWPYIRATCNPDADSWVASFLAWWLDPESGFPIPARAGVYNLGITHDGTRLLATNKRDQSVSIFDLKSGKELARLPTKRKVLHGVVVSPDDAYAFVTVEGVGSEPGTVEIIDLKAQKTVAIVDVGEEAAGVDFFKTEPTK